MRRRLIPLLVLPLLLLVACDARQQFPPGYTDIDLWSGPDVRIDTEVPDQYPNGTTRDAHGVDSFEGGGDEGH